MARKLYPMPVEPIIRHPAAIALPGAGMGALIRLCFHFWETECRPMPRDNHSLMQLARAHGPTWRHHKAEILAIFEAIRPELEAYHAWRMGSRAQLRIAARNGAATRDARAAAKRIDASQPLLAVNDHHQLNMTPKREPTPPRPPTPDAKPPRPIRTDKHR